jgi:hypothetical protein
MPRQDESGDWSATYHPHPALFLGLAVGVGLVIGVMRIRRRSDRSSLGPTGTRAPRRPLRERSPKVAQLATTWEQITDALLGVATARVVDAIARQVPGFKDQYERRSTRHESFRSAEMLSSGR